MRDAKVEFICRVGPDQHIRANVTIGPHKYVALLVKKK